MNDLLAVSLPEGVIMDARRKNVRASIVLDPQVSKQTILIPFTSYIRIECTA